MGLTQKILLFVSLLIVALVATTLLFTTMQASRLAHETIATALTETRGVWDTFQADRFNKLKLGVRVLSNDPGFKALLANQEDPETQRTTVLNTLRERKADLGSDFFIATDPDGVVIARSDRPSAAGDDLSKDALVAKSLAGEESATVWRQGGQLFHAVSVPATIGGDLIGVLVAGYGIDEALASDIRKLTHSEVAFLTEESGGPPRLVVSSLGSEEGAFREALGRPEFASATGAPFELDLAGDRHVGVVLPLKAVSGDVVGAVVALRSVRDEMAAFGRFRNSLILVSLVVMVLALAVAYVAAARITGPVRTLAGLVERARDGSYSGAVSVSTRDEIGVLARAFNGLLADLREKEQMITFLREGLTMMRKGASQSLPTLEVGETAAIASVPTRVGSKIEKGTLFADRYEILGTLGKGGMGAVYRARDRQLDEVVAVKVLRAELLKEDPTLLDRFKQEVRLARKITHRNVLRTHDVGETQGTPYISMEYLDGVTLKDLIQNKGALPVGVGLRIAKQMCYGLEAAHREGVIHRDIKPQNMLILPETGELKIMDFGIARRSEVKGEEGSGLTTAGTVMGTPDYMPPEQAQGNPVDFRSDIYSLGVVLFEIFVGRLPFRADNAMATVLSHVQQAPPKPRSLNTRIPEDLEAVILRCLEKDPSARFGSVGELLDALTSVSAHAESVA
jgi:HAMP domain-containing protein/predicted Ser/Thr protein kinase